MKVSYVVIGMTFRKLFRFLWLHKFSVHPKYIFRLFILFQGAIWSSIFVIVENLRHKRKIDAQPVPEKPVFIVGHWRTGSTLLHQLMALDNNFITPSVFQVSVPDCFIAIEKYYKPFMRKMMDDKRPMDNVKFGPDAPQEDEFALLRMTQNSPLQGLVFPSSKTYFLKGIENLIPRKTAIKSWERALVHFYKKLVYVSNKRILIKNPFHSMRIDILNKLFPDAVFIHIYRNPFDVVPSTVRMWDIIARQNCLNNKWTKPEIGEVAAFLNQMTQRIEVELSKMDTKKYIEVKFETLEANPIEEIKKIYTHFDMPFTEELGKKLQDFTAQEKDFKKNVYTLGKEEYDTIAQNLQGFIAKYHYEERA